MVRQIVSPQKHYCTTTRPDSYKREPNIDILGQNDSMECLKHGCDALRMLRQFSCAQKGQQLTTVLQFDETRPTFQRFPISSLLLFSKLWRLDMK